MSNRKSCQPTCLFAYGMLLQPKVQKKLLKRLCRIAPARLMKFRHVRGKWAYLVPSAAGGVSGAVLYDLTAAEFRKLDAFEGVQPMRRYGKIRRFYTRERVTAVLKNGVRQACWVYKPCLADWPSTWR
jgi:hypothetical protein